MPRKQVWTVRVINFESGSVTPKLANQLPGLWIEQLRYMGLAKELAHFDNPPRGVLEFYAPKGVDSKIWAEQNAERMQSFGINAAAAPRWETYDGSPADAPFRGSLNVEHMERLNRSDK